MKVSFKAVTFLECFKEQKKKKKKNSKKRNNPFFQNNLAKMRFFFFLFINSKINERLWGAMNEEIEMGKQTEKR